MESTGPARLAIIMILPNDLSKAQLWKSDVENRLVLGMNFEYVEFHDGTSPDCVRVFSM